MSFKGERSFERGKSEVLRAKRGVSGGCGEKKEVLGVSFEGEKQVLRGKSGVWGL